MNRGQDIIGKAFFAALCLAGAWYSEDFWSDVRLQVGLPVVLFGVFHKEIISGIQKLMKR